MQNTGCGNERRETRDEKREARGERRETRLITDKTRNTYMRRCIQVVAIKEAGEDFPFSSLYGSNVQ